MNYQLLKTLKLLSAMVQGSYLIRVIVNGNLIPLYQQIMTGDTEIQVLYVHIKHQLFYRFNSIKDFDIKYTNNYENLAD